MRQILDFEGRYHLIREFSHVGYGDCNQENIFIKMSGNLTFQKSSLRKMGTRLEKTVQQKKHSKIEEGQTRLKVFRLDFLKSDAETLVCSEFTLVLPHLKKLFSELKNKFLSGANKMRDSLSMFLWF